MKRLSILVFFFLYIGTGQTVKANDLKVPGNLTFEKFENEIKTIEKSDNAIAVAGEIAIAKRWIEQGKLLLSAGHSKKSALYAERLKIQLKLIRITIEVFISKNRNETIEQETNELLSKLKSKKNRLNRLLIRLNGAKLSSAFPQNKEMKSD